MQSACSRVSRLLSSLLWGAVLTLLLGIATGCDDETVGPETRGAIQGAVLDATSEEPVANVNITTSPPTRSVLTDDAGTFVLGDVPTGNYTIDAVKEGFNTGSTTINVRADDTTEATILLRREDDFGGQADSLTVELVDWFNERINRDSTGADSIFVNAEYEARNAGEVRITSYQIRFDIVTSENTFSEEQMGDTLAVGEFDIGRFRRYVRMSPATDVEVVDTFIETE
jgi:hypothetical protein